MDDFPRPAAPAKPTVIQFLDEFELGAADTSLFANRDAACSCVAELLLFKSGFPSICICAIVTMSRYALLAKWPNLSANV